VKKITCWDALCESVQPSNSIAYSAGFECAAFGKRAKKKKKTEQRNRIVAKITTKSLENLETETIQYDKRE